MSIFGIRETHSLEDWRAHEQDHYARGTVLLSGGDLGGWVAGSTVAAERQPTVSQTVLMDEDLKTTLPALASGVYTWAKIRRTTTTPRFCVEPARSEIVELTGSAPHYNYTSGANWTDGPISANDYAAMFVMAIPVTDDATSQAFRYVFIMPQHKGTLSQMQAVNVASLQLADVRASVAEFNFIAKIIIRYTAANWSITSVDKLLGSLIAQVALPSGNYLTTVATDGVTIEGNGTPTTPIRTISTEVITTSNDGSSAFTVTSKRKCLLTGSGSNHVISLPDATTLEVGDRFEIVNGSSEFVIVKNSGAASSVWEFLAPLEGVCVTCSGTATAAGTWVALVQDAPKGKVLKYFNDFTEMPSNSVGYNFQVSQSGTGALGGTVENPQVGTLGKANNTTGTDTNGYALFRTNNASDSRFADSGAIMFNAAVTHSAAYSVVEQYVSEFGMHDASTNGAITDGLWMSYDGLTDGNNWFIKASGSGAVTKVDTTIAASVSLVTQDVIQVVYANSRTRADVWINKEKVASVTGANLPVSAEDCYLFGARIVKVAGTTSRRQIFDYVGYTRVISGRV